MNRVETLEQKVRDLYELKNESRDEWSDLLYERHVFQVANKARETAVRFGIDADLAQVSGMLHDIADAVMSRFDECHKERSAEISRRFLKESGFDKGEIEIVVDDALKFHSCRDNDLPQTDVGKVMATADAVVHLTTDFYQFFREMKEQKMSKVEIAALVLPKIERDYNKKIFFDELRDEVQVDYVRLKEEFK